MAITPTPVNPATTLPSGRKLGNRIATYNQKLRWFAAYTNRSVVKVTPANEPIDMSVTPLLAANPWIMNGMLLNGPDQQAVAVLMSVFGIDQTTAQAIAAQGLGNCFWAAAVRRAAIAAVSVGKLLWTSYADMLKAALLGYTSTGWQASNSAATDQGTDPTQGFASLKSTGLLCSDGTYDKQTVQLAVNPADFEEVLIAFNISGGNMTIGVNFPAAWDSTNIWDATTSEIEGGHEIPLYSDLNVSPQGIKLDSWGEAGIIITPAGLAQQCTQCTVIIDLDEFGPSGKNIEGFDSAAIAADIP